MIRRAVAKGIDQVNTGLVLSWWALAPLVFYTLSVGKQPRYILPILPPLALLLANGIRQQIAVRRVSRLFTVATGLAGVTVVAMGVLLIRTQALLVEWSSIRVGVAATAIVASGCAILLTSRRPRWLPAALVSSAILVTLTVHSIVLASPGPSPVERIASLLVTERIPGATYGRYQVLHRNLIFYAHAPFVELPIEQAILDYLGESARVFCVVPADIVGRLETKGVAVRSLGEVRYLNTGNLTLRMLLDPDPERYLRRVALVTNR